MPKRKITLEEAFAVFEREGLQVEVKAVQLDQEEVPLSDFLEEGQAAPVPLTEPVNSKMVKITLYAAHSIASGGRIHLDKNGNKVTTNNIVETYGPGVITVPISLAQHLLAQDGLARNADERTFDRKFRSFIIIPRTNSQGISVNAAVQVSDQSNFDISALLGNLGNNGTYII